MRSIQRKDLPTYSFTYEKFCPYCGSLFFSDRRNTVFCSKKCHSHYYSFLQRDSRAEVFQLFKIPFSIEWRLQAVETIFVVLSLPNTDQIRNVRRYFTKSELLECIHALQYKPFIEQNQENPYSAIQELVNPDYLPKEFLPENFYK